MNWNHGTHGLLISYAASVATLLCGLLFGRAPAARVLLSPLIAIPVLIVAAILWTALAGLLKATGISVNVIPYLGLIFIALFSGVAGLLFARVPEKKSHKRGTLLEAVIPKPARGISKPNGLTLAGQPVPESDETKHFKMIGTTGTGKSTAIRELLTGALERGDRAVIADPDGSYLKRFYDPHRGDQILNPFDSRAARWNLFGEMANAHDADQLSRALIAEADGDEGPWRNYARVLLSSLLRQLQRVRHDDVGELYRLISTTAVDDLRELLADTPAASYLSQDNGRFFSAIRAVAITHLSALEHVALQSSGDSLSVRSWIRADRGVLFLPYRANEIATLRSIISTWMRLAIYETMSNGDSQPEGEGQRLWFAIDELDALGQIDGLKDALARLRKFGGRCILGLQSIAQVSGTYGRAQAQTIVENCGNTLILRCSASEGGGTAHFASSLIGEREIIREQITKSRGEGVILAHDRRSISTSFQHVTESAVLASEIEQLPDLQGFLKFASQPEWKKITLTIPSNSLAVR
jgi:type IV secretory pathway TraG/TraD family ATPase VirD4